MISNDITWRYFVSDAKSNAAKKLVAAENKVRIFNANFMAFRENFENKNPGLEIVGLTIHNAQAPQIKQLGVEKRDNAADTSPFFTKYGEKPM